MGIARKVNELFDNNEDWEQLALSVGYILDDDTDIEVLSDSWYEFPMEGGR